MQSQALMNTYGDRAITLAKGEGSFVWDTQGKRYLDAISGIAVCGLGHCHPAVTRALQEQSTTLLHCSNLYNIPSQQALGEILIRVSGMDRVFFSNSGAEANEAAIKIARKFGNEKGISQPNIITANQSFHGRTMATLSATGNSKVKEGFFPLLSGFKHADFNDIEAIRDCADENTVAVMVEPIQGEGGVHVPNEGYLKQLRSLCDDQGWLLILDEIQTGNGRTGAYFAYQHENILPDVVTTAKGLGNGAPIGACIARGLAADTLQPGNHGSTFGGNPLATAAALAVVNTLTHDNSVINNAAKVGQYIVDAFNSLKTTLPCIQQVRGKGMMIGIQVDADCTNAVKLAAELGVLINITGGNTIRLLPPLNLTQSDADIIISAVANVITSITQ